MQTLSGPASVVIASAQVCGAGPSPAVRLDLGPWWDRVHILSAATICFAQRQRHAQACCAAPRREAFGARLDGDGRGRDGRWRTDPGEAGGRDDEPSPEPVGCTARSVRQCDHGGAGPARKQVRPSGLHDACHGERGRYSPRWAEGRRLSVRRLLGALSQILESEGRSKAAVCREASATPDGSAEATSAPASDEVDTMPTPILTLSNSSRDAARLN